MKRFLTTACAVSAALALPATAVAAEPTQADAKNAAKFCKQLRAAAGNSFSQLYGT